MERKLSNKNKDNIVYLSEDDARALGIVEGDTQSVFVDGKKVDLVFVDEHEIFDATPEEQRILNNALNLRKRELARKYGAIDAGAKTNYLVPYGIIEDDIPNFDNLQVAKKGSGFFANIKTFFGKKHKAQNEPAKNILGRSNYRNRTDIFTNEEIEIIQEVISRAHGSNRHTYNYDYDYDMPTTTSTRKKKKTKRSSSVKRNNIVKAKSHDLSTLNKNKAKRDLTNRPVTSPKKKQARRAARRKGAKK